MMGLTDRVYWTNAFLVGLLNALPLCMLSTIALCVRFHSTAILKADYLLIFIVILCYAIGLIFLALLVSVLVKSGENRAVGGREFPWCCTDIDILREPQA